jgi:glutathione S-transferase
MAEFTLHCFAQSGNAYKAALMLNLCGADWHPEFVEFFKGGVRAPEFRAMNEMGEVPVLVHGDRRLSQSGVILDYLAETFGKFGWADGDERREIMRWILWDNHKLTGYTATYRYLKVLAPQVGAPAIDPAVVEFLKGRVMAAYKVLNAHLDGRGFAVLDRPTIADVSMCGYLYWPDEIGVDWQADFPHIHAWLARIEALPGWVHPYQLMPGHPLPAKA